MYKPILGLAAVVAATGYFIDSLGTANAEFSDPVISAGESPWVSFSGATDTVGGESLTLYTVPSDRALIITGAKIQTANADLYEGDTKRMEGSTATMSYGFLAHGNGHISFPPGSEVNLFNPISDTGKTNYLVTGYLTHP